MYRGSRDCHSPEAATATQRWRDHHHMTRIIYILYLDGRVVKVRVEHDDAERQNERRVCRREHRGVLQAKPLGKLLHHPVDLLSLPGEPEAAEIVSDSVVEAHALEVHHVDVFVQDLLPFQQQR